MGKSFKGYLSKIVEEIQENKHKERGHSYSLGKYSSNIMTHNHSFSKGAKIDRLIPSVHKNTDYTDFCIRDRVTPK